MTLPRPLSWLAVLLLSLLWPRLAAAEGEHWRLQRRLTVPTVARPAGAATLACSMRQPVCVHAVEPAKSLDAAMVMQTLASAERTLRFFSHLGMPPMRPDGGRGGSMALDIYLDPSVQHARGHADPVDSPTGFDLASGYAIVAAAPQGPACAHDSEIARALAQVLLVGMDAALNDSLIAAHSSYLASLAAPCPLLELEAIDRFQRSPERPLADARRDRLSGEMLLPWFLDLSYGTALPAAVMTGLVATSAQQTAADAYRFDDEPDVFDALRDVLPPRGKQLSDFMLDLAVARAFLGDRSTGVLVPDSERFGALGRVRFEWAIDYPSLPRRLAPLTPVSATGSTYLWLDLGAAQPGRGLLMVADWEESFVFQWALVRLDDSGRELGRTSAPALWGSTQTQLTIEELGDARHLLIVGTMLGGDDRGNPYDPDDGEARAAAYTVTLHARGDAAK